MKERPDTTVTALGPRTIPSPLTLSTVFGDGLGNFCRDEARVRSRVEIDTGDDNPEMLFESAGPRERIFFDPARTRAAIVTCGGLSPGLNTVIRSAFLELHHNYGVKEVLGIRFGYEGLNPAVARPPMILTPDLVDDIHAQGGTLLGTSRGRQPIAAMAEYLDRQGIDILLCAGGDGTQHGTHELAMEAIRRGWKKAVVGIPKTIDNDISYVRQTFGYFTAIEEARKVLSCAHTEAKGAMNGIGLVKVMGRHSGFIACGATLASQEANFCLIPEVPFTLKGERGFLRVLERRLLDREHAVIVVAEGAGQELMPEEELGTDASGNRKKKDIGLFLRDEILRHFAARKIPVNLKYFDPSYIIRSVPANSQDSLLCDQYARHAVHAAMAGKTDVLIGFWHGCFIHVPLPMAIGGKRTVSPESGLWNSVIATTGQPRIWV